MQKIVFTLILFWDVMIFGLVGGIYKGFISSDEQTRDNIGGFFIGFMGFGFVGFLIGCCVVFFFRVVNWVGTEKPLVEIPAPYQKQSKKPLQVLGTIFVGLFVGFALFASAGIGKTVRKMQLDEQQHSTTTKLLESKIAERPEFKEVEVGGCCGTCGNINIHGYVKSEQDLQELKALVNRAIGSRYGARFDWLVSIDIRKGKP